MRKIPAVILFSILFLSGCALRQTPTPLVIPTVWLPPPTATLEIVTPTETPPPTRTPTPAPTATPQPVLPIPATVNLDNFILREGPGRLFERVVMYSSGAEILVIGRSLGPDWVLVQTEDDRSGWMNTGGLDHRGDFSSLPIYQYSEWVILKGHVWNVDQSPAAGIGVRVMPAGNTDSNQQEDVTTSKDGAWYACLPADASGSWEVHLVSYSCPAGSSEGQCLSPGQFPPFQTVSLPDALSVNIEFNLLP